MFEAFLLYVITCIWANIEWYFRMGYGKIRQKHNYFGWAEYPAFQKLLENSPLEE